MTTQVCDVNQLDLSTSRRALLLVWQDPSTRRFVKVGQIDALPRDRFAFHYLDTAWENSRFRPLLEFPDRDAAYLSDEVPAFFANRILSAERRGYHRYLEWLGVADLSRADLPFEVLARTGGGRETDTFHVVDLPVDTEQNFSSRFFVSGVRHRAGSSAAVDSLQPGAALELRLDEQNSENPKAVLVDAEDGMPVGYVPDWLCADVHDRVKGGWTVSAVAERINPDAPPHVRVLCRIDAARR